MTDPVTVLDEGDRAAVDGFGGDVADAEAVGPAREPAVGDERDVAAPAGALHGTGDGQHLAHARAALGALVADDDDVAGVRSGRRGPPPCAPSSPSKTRAGPSKWSKSMPATLTTAPFGASEPVQDGDAARCRGWVADSGCTTSPSGAGGSMSARFSATVLPVTVRQSPWSRPSSSRCCHDDRHATDAVDVDHVVLAVRLGVGDVGDPGRDLVEVVEVELDLGLVGDGEQVQHGVGRAAEGHDDGDGVLERLLGHDLAGPDVLLAAGRITASPDVVGEVVAPAVDGRRLRPSPGSDMPRASATDGHGVGGEHAGAAALARDRRCARSRRARPRSIVPAAWAPTASNTRDDVERLAVEVAGQDRAAVEEHRRAR